MLESRRFLVVAALVVTMVVLTTSAAMAAITWPANDTRTKEQPRTWNTSNVGDRISGSHYGGSNTVAVSNNVSTNYIHTVMNTDGAAGALDVNNLPSRPAKYPYFGGQVAYGGNDAPHFNDGRYGFTPYWDGDCGVMRPHLLTDDFDVYKGSWIPETLTGGTATLATGGVLTLTDDQLANFDKIEVGDRLQTTGFTPSVFNRTAYGAGPTMANKDPLTNAPYWRVTGTPAWNQVTAVPDAATARTITAATWVGGVATFESGHGGDAMFQGMQVGQQVTISGMTPGAWNGTYNVLAAPVTTPWIFTVSKAVNPGAATVLGTAIRDTDGIYKHDITAATAVGTTATFTTSVAHGLVVGEGVDVAGMTPAGYNGSWTVATVPTATTFTATLGSSPAAGTVMGIATVRTATATVMGALMRGSDCSRAIYVRSSDNGVNWDGGGTGAGANGCTPSATCGSAHAYNLAGGGTNGGINSYLSEMQTTGAMVQTYQQYVYAMFFSTNGGVTGYWADECTNDPRVAYLRVNNNYGAWDAWGAPIRITPAAGQVSYPVLTIDKANGNLYLLSVDAETGQLMLYKSINQGGAWTSTYVEDQNYKGYTGYKPADDPGTNNPTTPCINDSRNGIAGGGTGAGSDGIGFGGAYNPAAQIAVYNDTIGIAWLKNLAGTKLMGKISNNGGTSWQSAVHLAKAGGAGGQCQGYGCGVGGPTDCPYPFSTCSDDTLNNSFSVAAGPAAAGNRVDFAWVNDGGIGKQSNWIPRGLYFKEYASTTNSWAADRLLACMQGNPSGPLKVGTPGGSNPVTGVSVSGGMTPSAWVFSVANTWAPGDMVRITGMVPRDYSGDYTITARNASTVTVAATTDPGAMTTGGTMQVLPAGSSVADPCIGKAATATHMDLHSPKLAMWGTTGVGVVYIGCQVGPKRPCQNNAADPGSEVLYKESGNSGLRWGADWSVVGGGGNGGAFKTVATRPLAAQSYGDAYMWTNNRTPDLIYDTPGDSTSGCTQQGSGAPSVGCSRYVFFVGYTGGANPAYNSSYVQFLMRGVQT